MANQLKVERKLTIHAPAARVWKALTDPDEISQYLFGTHTESDWKKGSPITYRGEWQGKTYLDKGTIIDIEPGKLLHTTYFSSMSGKPDLPENYAHVVYRLEQKDKDTVLTLTQDNIETEDQLRHLEGNWDQVLGGLKKLVENSPGRA